MPNQNERTFHLKSEMFENLSLHLDDVEFLQNAFLVQATLGSLVRFSNRGRYEPYVAKSWSQSDNLWQFQLHDGLTCEDGQVINALSFRKSLIGSLARFSNDEIQQTPFAKLKGVQSLNKDGNPTDLGITATGNQLTFEFVEPMGKAFLEYLAMSPFAFLCDSNFENGRWKSRESMISSGPYKVLKFDRERNICELELRKEWPLNPPGSFQKVILSQDDLGSVKTSAAGLMTYGLAKSNDSQSGLVSEVPRALLSVRLGIEKDQFFADRDRRRLLQSEIRKILNSISIPFENYHRAESFFFGQVSGHENAGDLAPTQSTAPKSPLKIRGIPKGKRPEVDFYQGVLFSALEKLGWAYEISTTPITSTKEFFNLSYDIAFDRAHVDATLDPDFIKLLFKSKLGPRYQDPGNRISQLVDDFENGRLSYRDFLISFNTIIFEEAAIVPLFHRGFAWKFTSNIDVQSVSPLMSILRYEELLVKPDGRN